MRTLGTQPGEGKTVPAAGLLDERGVTQGLEDARVILTEKPSASRSVVEAFRGLYANFLVQEFVAEADGADIRCFVVGDKVVAAMRRQAAPGEFRSNLHRGGHAPRGRRRH